MQQVGQAKLGHRIGEGEVVRVFRKNGGETVVKGAGKEEYLGIIENAAQLQHG